MISKRRFLLSLPICASLAIGMPAWAATPRAFDQAAFDAARASGAPILVFVAADWCPTCRAQTPLITQIGNDRSFANMQIFRLDFDAQKVQRRALRASRQSTLIVFKGNAEVGRSVGATNPVQIRTLMQLAIS